MKRTRLHVNDSNGFRCISRPRCYFRLAARAHVKCWAGSAGLLRADAAQPADQGVLEWYYTLAGAALIPARTEVGSLSMARSPKDTMPTTRPFSITGKRRIDFSFMTFSASSSVFSADKVVTSVLQIEPSSVCPSRPDARARTTISRSVTIPQKVPSSSSTTTAPISSSLMTMAASRTLAFADNRTG